MKPRHKKRIQMLRKRAPGQSLVLIAMILAILIGLVALAVDVGNAYAEQRAAQRASDAASIEGMRLVLAGGTRGEIYSAITASLDGHNIKWVGDDASIQAQPGQRKLTAVFVKGNGSVEPVMGGSVDQIPSDVNYVEVILDGTQATNFAGVVGRGTLPVNANSYANADVCPPYPIAVNKDAFYSPTFGSAGADDQLYSDNVFTKKQLRRMYLRDDLTLGTSSILDVPGQFVWLSWQDPLLRNQAGDLTDAFQDAVNNIVNYREVPWNNVLSLAFGSPPASYPDRPGIVSAWDVMYGSSTINLGQGYKSGAGFNGLLAPSSAEAQVIAQLKWHIDNRTYMNLPEYDKATGLRDGGRYRISSFGGYMITGYGYMPKLSAPNPSRGSGWFIDLVKVGPALNCPSNQNAVFLSDTVDLAGSIKIRPQFSTTPESRKPVDVVMVLDASGSMNWDWDGNGTASQTLINDLTNAGALPPGAGVGKSIDCFNLLALAKGCQSADAYGDYTKRRVYQAKQAVQAFIEGFQWRAGLDRAAIVTYSGSGAGTQIKTWPPTGLTTNIVGGTGSGSVVDLLINQAASKNPGSTDLSALYTTLGGSPGALGLQQARSLMSSSSGDRERVVIFLTDGLLNVGLDKVISSKETLAANYDRTWQTDLPINQAGRQADLIKDENSSTNASIYVLALGSQFDQGGLDYIPSSTSKPFFDTATSGTALQGLLKAIGFQITNGTCDPSGLPPEVPPADQMGRWNGTDYVSPVKNAQSQDTLGTVTVRNAQDGLVTRVDILEDGTFLVPKLQPNSTYKLSFNKPSDDPVSYYGLPDQTYRNYSIIEATGADSMDVRTASTGLGSAQAVNNGTPVLLRIKGDICPAQ